MLFPNCPPPLQERAFLASTLRDTKSVCSKLERLLGALLHTLCCFAYLFIFGVSRPPARPPGRHQSPRRSSTAGR